MSQICGSGEETTVVTLVVVAFGKPSFRDRQLELLLNGTTVMQK
jgi:hypothetical protein